MFLCGLTVLLYPTASSMLAQWRAEKAITQYMEEIEDLPQEQLEEQLREAEAYNDMLSGSNIEDPFVPDSGFVLPHDYTSILNFNGIMGYIEIPAIDIKLPIRHGTSEETLSKGTGHLEATAFPIGGSDTHSVITGHRGLPSAKLFTDLDLLEEGDVFYIHVADQVLAYEIDQILVVTPLETEELRPVQGEDYVTLITCTPYGINTHRMFVRGTRIVYDEDILTDIYETQSRWQLAAAAAVCLVIVVFGRRRTKRKK